MIRSYAGDDQAPARYGDHEPFQPVQVGRDQRCLGPATPRAGRSRRWNKCSKTYRRRWASSPRCHAGKGRPPAAPTLALAIIFVFLLLAALYEVKRLPWAVLLGSPLVALGSFFGVWLMGYDNNVYVQIGNIMLISSLRRMPF